jgi:SAM-dependent methyltransferase
MVDSALPLVRKLRKRGRKLFRMAAPAPNYQPGCKYHGRGVEHLDSKLASAGLPDVTTLIEKCLERKGHCKVLETGCGEGRLLLELLHRFGTRIELHGSNVGDWPVMFGKNPLQRSNEHYHVMPVERLRTLPQPTIHTADVQELSAFPVRDFDFIFSQAMMQHVPDKARGLEQSATLLSSDGMFVHELDRLDLPPLDFLDADLPRFTIYAGASRISTIAYLRERGIDVLDCDRVGVPGYLAVYRKTESPLSLGLTIDRESTLRLRTVTACNVKIRMWGARSVYRIAA